MLASRYYGEYTESGAVAEAAHRDATQNLKLINAARRRGKQIWTYTYDAGSHVDAGFSATESADDPRVFVDWAALEGITGLLYGQGTTTYAKGNPLDSIDKENGSFVLVYPGRDGPIPSARLEVLREGIEDWEILNVVRHKQGTPRACASLVAGLFSISGANANLGCTIGCTFKTSTKYSWPTWSNDASTPGKVASMRAAALGRRLLEQFAQLRGVGRRSRLVVVAEVDVDRLPSRGHARGERSVGRLAAPEVAETAPDDRDRRRERRRPPRAAARCRPRTGARDRTRAAATDRASRAGAPASPRRAST